MGCIVALFITLIFRGNHAMAYFGTCVLGLFLSSMSPTIMSLTELFIDINGELSIHNRKQNVGKKILKWLLHIKYVRSQYACSKFFDNCCSIYIKLHVYNSFCGNFFFLYMVNSPYSVLSGRQCGAG